MANGDRPDEENPITAVIVAYVDVILIHRENLTFAGYLFFKSKGKKILSLCSLTNQKNKVMVPCSGKT